jgi:elongation factor Ts
MSEITTKDIQALRQATGAGILDCRKALQENAGDLEAAKQWLREKGLVSAGRRAERESSEGAVAVVVTGGADQAGAVVELRCETDFVAKSPDFVALVDKLAALVADEGTEALESLAGEIDELKVTLKENIGLGRVERFAAPAGSLLGSYLHIQSERGVNGVLVEVAGGSPEIAHELALHIAFARPRYLRKQDVPAELIEAERATFESLARNEGKPEAALAKIVEGRLHGWLAEQCLLEQKYVRDEKLTIAGMLGDATVTRFAQVVIGG